MFLAKPGTAGPLVALQDAARDLHERNRDAIRRRIETRTKHGAGPDERTDFSRVALLASNIQTAAQESDAGAVLAAVQAIAAMTSPPLTVPGEYEPHESLDGVFVRFRVLSEARRQELSVMLDAANAETARQAPGTLERHRADEAALAVVAMAVCETVAEIRYTEIDSDGTETQVTAPVDLGVVETLRTAGLLTPVYVSAMAFQDLPAKKAWRFGLPPQSTSKSATATDADPAKSALSGVGVTALPRTRSEHGTLPGLNMQPIAAPVVISSTIPISSTLSPLAAQSVTGSGSMGSTG